MPLLSSPPRNSRKAKPSPPAAPDPGTSAFPPETAAKCASAASSSATISGVAPFCGPNTALAPRSPQSGFPTSHAMRKTHSPSSGIAVERSIEASAASPPPPRWMSQPSPSRSRKPSAWSIPAPPSFVALPPMPTTNRRQPCSIASRIISPTPKVVVRSGFFSLPETSVIPEACAISMTAVSPTLP